MLHPECLGHFSGLAGAISRVSVSVLGGKPSWGPQGRVQAQTQCGAQGAQAKPHGWSPSSLTIYTPRSTSQPRHPTICLVGQMVAGWPEDLGARHFCLVTC